MNRPDAASLSYVMATGQDWNKLIGSRRPDRRTQTRGVVMPEKRTKYDREFRGGRSGSADETKKPIGAGHS